MINLSKKEIDLLHMKKGHREIKFRYDLLNSDEIKIGELTAIDGDIELNSLAQIKRRGKFVLKENELQDIDWLNDRIQPFFMLKNGDSWIEYPLGIFLIASPTRSLKSTRIDREVEVYDSTWILQEDKFVDRYLIKENSNYVDEIIRIINDSGIWKVNIKPNSGVLKNDKEFEMGTSKLEAVNELLEELNYTSIWVDELGFMISEPYILPDVRSIEYEYKNNDMSIILPDTSIEELDIFNVPNSWVVVATNPDIEEPLVARYTNDNPLSLTSTVNRKRRIVDFREIDDILDQKTLDDYIKRIAYESSNVFGKFIFDTALMPHHSYMDALNCQHSRLGINNKYIETSWSMRLRNGGTMKHNCRRVIQI